MTVALVETRVEEIPPNPLAERPDPSHRYSVLYKIPKRTDLKLLLDRAEQDLAGPLQENVEALDIGSIQIAYDIEALRLFRIDGHQRLIGNTSTFVRLTFLSVPTKPSSPMRGWDGWPLGRPE